MEKKAHKKGNQQHQSQKELDLLSPKNVIFREVVQQVQKLLKMAFWRDLQEVAMYMWHLDQ